jgi:hypothetical protein
MAGRMAVVMLDPKPFGTVSPPRSGEKGELDHAAHGGCR